MRHGVGLLALAAVVLAGCSEQPEPVVNPGDSDASAVATEYDPSLAPSAAVLPLVPEAATTLEITDFDQIRLTLGFGNLTSRSPQSDRDLFWRGFRTSAAFSDGLLRPADKQLRSRFGFSQDDVAWEAHYSGGGVEGWVLVFHEKVPVDRISRAVRSGAGALKGAVLDTDRGIVSSAELPEPDASWAADETLVELVGRQANATYVERGCVPLDDVYGEGTVDSLEGRTEVDVASLRELTGFSVALGGELGTVHLGEARDDGFTRLRLAEHLPAMKPEFATVFSPNAADPASGRLGYDIPRPRVAAEWTHARKLPFAACNE